MEIREIKDIRKFLPDININRNILPDIIKWLTEKEIIVLLGARQVGKTTIIFQLINHILSLAATELRFSDGSSLRNDFSNGVINQPLAPELFEGKLAPDFTVVEPLRQ